MSKDQLAEQAQSIVKQIAGDRASTPRIREGRLSLALEVGGLDDTARDAMERALHEKLAALAGISRVDIVMTRDRADLPSAPRIIAVGSGKGGVGKSTLSANLAVAMARAGRKVGLIDADIHGPSQSRLMGQDEKPLARDKKLVPVIGAGGVPFLSMGQLAKPGQPIAWRGPMVSNALGQLVDAEWAGISDLIVDLPPGTGDIQLSMIQKHKPAGAVIVSTPQDLALMDATRAIAFFETAGVPIVGMVENMAGYVCPHCGEVSDPFGSGGAEAEAARLGLPFLGRIPLTLDIRKASDAGVPPALGSGPESDAFAAIAAKVANWIDAQGNKD